jgi:hypothetical protein
MMGGITWTMECRVKKHSMNFGFDDLPYRKWLKHRMAVDVVVERG